METTVKERVVQFIKYLGIGQRRFETTVGLSNGYVNNLKASPTPAKLQKILYTYPQLNPQWLLFGQGDMLLEEEIAQERGDQLEIFETYLLPMSAMGGSLVGFDTEGARLTDCEKVISPIAGADFAITVTGDSMYPKYPSGCRILIKQINPRAFIEWGKAYVLDTCNGIIIKEVQPSDAEDEILCHSINPSGRYKDFHVSLYDVRGMYRILASVRMD